MISQQNTNRLILSIAIVLLCIAVYAIMTGCTTYKIYINDPEPIGPYHLGDPMTDKMWPDFKMPEFDKEQFIRSVQVPYYYSDTLYLQIDTTCSLCPGKWSDSKNIPKMKISW